MIYIPFIAAIEAMIKDLKAWVKKPPHFVYLHFVLCWIIGLIVYGKTLSMLYSGAVYFGLAAPGLIYIFYLDFKDIKAKRRQDAAKRDS